MVRFTQFALDNLPDAAYWVEEDSSIGYVNDAACRMLGYTKAELLSKRITELNVDFQPSLWPAMWQKLKQAKKRTLRDPASNQGRAGHTGRDLLQFRGV